jgi:uncharacterized protein (DUF2342 family)
VQQVVARAGWSALARMWEDAEAFPKEEELSAPEAWLARVAQ